MKSKELKKRLQQKNIPTDLYNLDGIGRTDERFCLEFTGSEWHVYYSERGIKTTYERFSSEDAACDFIYKQLLN